MISVVHPEETESRLAGFCNLFQLNRSVIWN